MTRARIANAIEGRRAQDAMARAIIVTGDESSRHYWSEVLDSDPTQTSRSHGASTVIAERGRKGNFLGALQAHQRVMSGELSSRPGVSFDQLVMLVGSGTRLSPLTQSLRNMKAALVLPDGDGPPAGLTVGEAAVRSTAPWIRALTDGGFDGIVMRWGDEIMIPSAPLESSPGLYAAVDAVRFGYRVTPTDLLATQKEWLVSDADLTVHAELPRQSLENLEERIAQVPDAHSLHVNLGSFAASHRLLAALTFAFGDLLEDATTAANWDPYVWMALHSESAEEWEADCCAAPGVTFKDFAALVAVIPDLWHRAQAAKQHLFEATGRPLLVKVLDFGDPYWFDAGNHASLRTGYRDIFEPGLNGDTIRAFLGLPEVIARGGSHVVNSDIPDGVVVRNSVVVGSFVDAGSTIEGAIVVNSRVECLTARPGAMVMECLSESLVVDGPDGFGFRLSGSATIAGDEVSAMVGIPPDAVRLSHFDVQRIVDDAAYTTPQRDNALSFQEAAAMVEKFDPIELRDHWRGARVAPSR